jgi:hypothetical protein
MTAVVVVVMFRAADDHGALGQCQKLMMLRHSSRMRVLNAST